MRRFNIFSRSASDANLKYGDMHDDYGNTWQSETQKPHMGRWQRLKKAMRVGKM